ncbi:MAG: hypothetical protein ACLPX9_08890 [Rhodomicrobium sp.]
MGPDIALGFQPVRDAFECGHGVFNIDGAGILIEGRADNYYDARNLANLSLSEKPNRWQNPGNSNSGKSGGILYQTLILPFFIRETQADLACGSAESRLP